jgi:hypothetical protein
VACTIALTTAHVTTAFAEVGATRESTAVAREHRAKTHRFDGSGSALLLRTGPSTFSLDGTAAVTGLGRSRYHEVGTFTTFEHWTATGTLTSPNGDIVTFTSVGGVQSVSVGNIVTHETITGGTGRFARARGSTRTTGQTVLSPQGIQTYTFRFTGSITRARSARHDRGDDTADDVHESDAHGD